MKRNLISILILALLIVNVVLTAIMMFTVVGTSQKTAALVNDIATAMSLDIADGTTTDEAETEIAVSDIATYKFDDQLTIVLKDSGDGKDHYFVTSVSFSMNTKDEDYETYGSTISTQEDLLKSIVYNVISNYTLDDLRADNNAAASKEILDQIQAMYNSDFIFKVNFIDFLYS